MKTCWGCGKSKPRVEFDKRNASPDGLSYRCKVCTKAYRDANKETRKKSRRAHYERNMATEKTKALLYYHLNRAHCVRRMREYKERNPEKIKGYFTEHYANFVANTAKRRAALDQRTPKWLTPQQLKEMQELYQCAAMLKKIYGTSFHVDHIVPLRGKTVSGLHVPWNLQILSATDNIAKGCRHETV